MQLKEIGNLVGTEQNIKNALNLDKFTTFLNLNSSILEYGCGDGHLLNSLITKGYSNLIGYDFSISMVERGRNLYPECDLRFLKEKGKIPLQNESIDAVILATVLCCIPDTQKQLQLLVEIFRILKPKGILYLTDFIISNDPRAKGCYEQGWQEYGEWGLYSIHSHHLIRHHSTKSILSLLNNFDIQWFEQSELQVANSFPMRVFHCIAQKN
ncbi:tRNA (Cmo5U34)-methyltransferase [Chlamydiales bacterium STE3]|nr:tRNA (Cmo5U34)-methyltransferase [Chlamydiales bacterium STE3]